jgi:hypothetical protein
LLLNNPNTHWVRLIVSELTYTNEPPEKPARFTNDIVGLSGLNYSDLTVQQGTGSYSSHVVVQETSSGDFLLIMQNQSIGNIDDNDFSAI